MGITGRLANKVVIVTGAGIRGEIAGTGQATSILMAREGAKILLADINFKRVQLTHLEIKKEGGESSIFIGDVTKEKDCKSMIEKCVQLYGRIDILFNNVGGFGRGSVVEIEEKDWYKSTDLNLKSVIMSCKHAIPYMSKSGGGSIINISSIDGIRAGGSLNVPYSVSKAGVAHLTRIMAVHHGRENIRVNCIAPGHIWGSFPNAKEKISEELRELRRKVGPLGTEGTAWDIAWAVVFLASDESKWISGIVMPIDAGVHAASPLSVWENMNEE